MKILFLPILEVCHPIADNEVWNKPAFSNEIELNVAGQFAEILLFADQIIIYSPAANLALALLEKWFGFQKLIQLIDDNTLKFILLPGLLSYANSNNISSGIISGKPGPIHFIAKHSPNDKSSIDPYESAQYALRRQSRMNISDINHLAKKCADSTKFIKPENIFPMVFEMTELEIRDLHQKGIFCPTLSKEKLSDLPFEYHGEYLNILKSNVHFLLSAIEKIPLLEINKNDIPHSKTNLGFQQGDKIIKGFQDIIDLENMVNISTLFKESKISLNEVIKIRRSKHGEEFRKWFNTIDSSKSANEFVKMYNSSLPKHLINQGIYKTARLLLSIFSNPIVEIGLSIFEKLVLEKIKLGWSPKLFIESIKKGSHN